MNLNDYQIKAMATCLPSSDNYTYMKEGLSEELGELSGVIAKAKRKGYVTIVHDEFTFTDKPTVDQRNEIMTNIKKELGDIYWMVAGLTRVLGLTMENVAQMNLDKLADRERRGVIDGKGDNR